MTDAATSSSRIAWASFGGMVGGTFFATLDGLIVASSLLEIGAGVSASTEEISWVQTSYLIAQVIGLPLSGLLGRAVSMRKLFVLSALGFTVTSVACAFAWDINSLIFFRALQGFTGAAMPPTALAAAFVLFPAESRAPAIAAFAMVSTVAPTVGPSLGGWITDALGWEWLFLINLVPGLACAAIVWRLSPLCDRDPSLLRRVDVAGLISLAVFLGSLLYLLEEGPRHDWLADETILMTTIAMLLSSSIFFWRAFTAASPVVDLRVFTDRNFLVGSLVSVAVGIAMSGSIYLMPLFLSGVRGYDSIAIGNVMAITGLSMFLFVPIISKLERKVDLRVVLAIGITMTAFGLWHNAQLTAESGFWELVLPQILRGAGLMMCILPMTSLALGTLPPHAVQNGSGLHTLTRLLGGALGLAVINNVLYRSIDFHRAELAVVMSTRHANLEGWLDQTTAAFSEKGVADPRSAALSQLAAIVDREATVMAINNVFLLMAAAVVALLPLIYLIRRGESAGHLNDRAGTAVTARPPGR